MIVLPEFKDFALVDGTALSLLYGHRISEDLDVFSDVRFESELILKALQNHFGDAFENRTIHPRFGIMGYIGKIKVDIIKHPHPIIREIKVIEGIRFFSTEDIPAMKVLAILGRGKKKYFWDIAELLKHYTVADFVQLHKEKYTTQNLLITLPQVMTYFDDADESEDPISLQRQTWESVKAFISEKVREYLA